MGINDGRREGKAQSNNLRQGFGLRPTKSVVKAGHSGRTNLKDLECGRFTYSDNIDDYASPKSTANDVYHILNFTITYKINSRQKDLPVSRK
jgi:hypothetical protein